MGEEWRGGGWDAFRDLHFGIMSTFVNVKIVRFAVIVNKDRKKEYTILQNKRRRWLGAPPPPPR